MAIKHLILFRGLPGSGKSSLASALCNKVYSADMYFETMTDSGDMIYNFDATKLRDAHSWCRRLTEAGMYGGANIIGVANTFTQEWEMAEYFVLAEKYGYRISTVICENRHNSENIHGVSSEVIDKMEDRFEVKLY
jgi:predicted kinase